MRQLRIHVLGCDAVSWVSDWPLEDESITVLQNARNHLPNDSVTFQKTQNSSNAARRISVPSIYIVMLSIPQTVYRVSHKSRSLLRESVPYVKIYRYNPKHLYPKLNSYGDNGHRKVWASGVSTYCTPSVMPYSSTAHARQRDVLMQWPWRMLYSTVALTSQDKSQLRPA